MLKVKVLEQDANICLRGSDGPFRSRGVALKKADTTITKNKSRAIVHSDRVAVILENPR